MYKKSLRCFCPWLLIDHQGEQLTIRVAIEVWGGTASHGSMLRLTAQAKGRPTSPSRATPTPNKHGSYSINVEPCMPYFRFLFSHILRVCPIVFKDFNPGDPSFNGIFWAQNVSNYGCVWGWLPWINSLQISLCTRTALGNPFGPLSPPPIERHTAIHRLNTFQVLGPHKALKNTPHLFKKPPPPS